MAEELPYQGFPDGAEANSGVAGSVSSFVVEADLAGLRLDQFLVRHAGGLSRSYLARAIEKGAVRVDGVVARASLPLKAGSIVLYTVPQPPRSGPEAEEIPLDCLYVDELMAAVNKPAGMVVHPAKGNWKGTLASALKWHLEKQETGAGLSTVGGPQFDRDEINLPIGIHPYQREKMAVRADHSTSRDAVTRFEVVERFRGAALVRLAPKTGRTHQIRVHMAAIGCPVLCDALYSGRSVIEPALLGLPPGPPVIQRQALHAQQISIDHPLTGERLQLEAPLPADMEQLLALLRGR